ncbi:hypothetical protein BD626DRAFT_540777 [Schizophyllum amplum]|uniref:Uncharacterized protein n=1 Tax=Schizophyllum amplum TaxID=97359 RepID=A0A550BWY1_9AGAR|nr:hypothetical protein BD626DRAFT_540777 [Auriculariopsis ampla]
MPRSFDGHVDFEDIPVHKPKPLTYQYSISTPVASRHCRHTFELYWGLKEYKSLKARVPSWMEHITSEHDDNPGLRSADLAEASICGGPVDLSISKKISHPEAFSDNQLKMMSKLRNRCDKLAVRGVPWTIVKPAVERLKAVKEFVLDGSWQDVVAVVAFLTCVTPDGCARMPALKALSIYCDDFDLRTIVHRFEQRDSSLRPLNLMVFHTAREVPQAELAMAQMLLKRANITLAVSGR